MWSYTLICILLFVDISREVLSLRCDRKPYGTTTQVSAPDGRYKLQVVGTDGRYIPDQLYVVELAHTDDESTFIDFMISVEGDAKPDPGNPRKMISFNPGDLRPQSSETTKFSERCPNSLEQTTNTLKTSIEVYWQAPSSGNGCVTLRAMVAENEDSWYADGSLLTCKLCEDLTQPDDISPQLNLQCSSCDEAKYELMFTGIWSRNTHTRMYPENDWEPRYSDLVGASHDINTILWSPGSLASEGLRTLAEHANTTQFEAEIKEKINNGVRTLIKGKGHKYPKMNSPTYAFFRVDKTNHLITVAVGLHPSPDWFLGVSRFELCQADSTWLLERELNLYPWDAGTDSGVYYEALNVVTFPQDAINRVEMSSYDKNSPFFESDMKDVHPFGTLRMKLIRTYQKECQDEETTTEGSANTTESNASTSEPTTEYEENSNQPQEPSRYQNELPSTDDRGSESTIGIKELEANCPLSDWENWSPCDGVCVNGKIIGHKWRERYHLVNNVPVEKYEPDVKTSADRVPVPEICKEKFDDFQTEKCEVSCSDNKITAQGRRNFLQVLPGEPWRPDLQKS